MRAPPLAAVNCALLLACSSDGTNPSNPPPVCSAPQPILESSRPSPTISVTPACRLFFVNIELGATDQWSVISDSTNAIAPPVRYGIVPAGAQQSSSDPPSLEAGETYDVNLFYWSGPGAQDGTFIGTQEFTP